MKLYIGAKGSGQALTAEAETGVRPEKCSPEEALERPGILDFHLVIRQVLEAGGSPQEYAAKLVRQNPQAVVVSDEIGMGIVPLEAFDRRWREETGRALCILAQNAQRVVRVTCGIGQVIK